MHIIIQSPKEYFLQGVTQALVNLEVPLLVWNANIPFNDFVAINRHLQPLIAIVYNEYVSSSWNLEGVQLVGIGNTQNQTELANNYLTYEPQAAASILPYTKPALHPQYQSDIFYLSATADLTVLKWLQHIEQQENITLKIVGPHQLPLTSYLGRVKSDDVIKFSTQCKIALTFDLYSLYQYAANHVFCITNLQNDLYPHFTDTAQLQQLINRYLFSFQDMQDSIKNIVQAAHLTVTHNHTYFHILNQIFTDLGYENEAQQCLNQLENNLEQNKQKGII